MIKSFSPSILQGKIFYLEVQDQQILQDTIQKLTYFGGQISTFLNSNVNCLVTDKIDHCTQPLQKPFSVQNTFSFSQFLQPTYQTPNVTTKLFNNTQQLLRSQQMLQLLNFNSSVSIANQLGINIQPVHDFRIWLNKNILEMQSPNNNGVKGAIQKNTFPTFSNKTNKSLFYLKDQTNKEQQSNLSIRVFKKQTNSSKFPDIQNKIVDDGSARRKVNLLLQANIFLQNEEEKMKNQQIQTESICGDFKEKENVNTTAHIKIQTHTSIRPNFNRTKIGIEKEKAKFTKLKKVKNDSDICPYIKLESTNSVFCPVSKEFKQCAIPDTLSFLYKRSRSRNRKFSFEYLRSKQKQKIKQIPPKVIANGYCEICKKRYQKIEKHILNKRHRKFARNNEKYFEIDLLIDHIQNNFTNQPKLSLEKTANNKINNSSSLEKSEAIFSNLSIPNKKRIINKKQIKNKKRIKNKKKIKITIKSKNKVYQDINILCNQPRKRKNDYLGKNTNENFIKKKKNHKKIKQKLQPICPQLENDNNDDDKFLKIDHNLEIENKKFNQDQQTTNHSQINKII
ncbi:activator of s-phase kinase-related [Anaeramoeba flamelloides]|uniref:Activator of s-phase kinase-related n=1 Tax=Anaeramoeba flamelloides TaxID=1746091 RepID=A0AAV7YHJ1_9EUKA|nr:activator of s-phase kinase-related [Anaeramoeba flamelloides]